MKKRKKIQRYYLVIPKSQMDSNKFKKRNKKEFMNMIYYNSGPPPIVLILICVLMLAVVLFSLWGIRHTEQVVLSLNGNDFSTHFSLCPSEMGIARYPVRVYNDDGNYKNGNEKGGEDPILDVWIHHPHMASTTQTDPSSPWYGKTLFILHGTNSLNSQFTARIMHSLLNHDPSILQARIIFPEYRGFGSSEGTTSSIKTPQDMEQIYMWAYEKKWIRPETTWVLGYSAGGAYANTMLARLALHNPNLLPAHVHLISTIPSYTQAFVAFMPSVISILSSVLDNPLDLSGNMKTWIKAVVRPTFLNISESKSDVVVPFGMGKMIAVIAEHASRGNSNIHVSWSSHLFVSHDNIILEELNRLSKQSHGYTQVIENNNNINQ